MTHQTLGSASPALVFSLMAPADGDMRSSEPQATLVIAEVGVNHNGDVETAHRLIDVAAAAGADVVKFQTFEPSEVVAPSARTAQYQRLATGSSDQLSMLTALTLPAGALRELADHCADVGVEFLSTAFDWSSLEALLAIGMQRIKIPSGELDNGQYLTRASLLGLPLIISTGMSDWADVDRAIALTTAAPAVTLLHCVSLYPTPPSATNLSVIPEMRKRYGVPVGWSDHTLGVNAAVIAVALGCRVIEKHITLDRSMPGPDHSASADPEGFGIYVGAIRESELMMGTPDKRRAPGEDEVAFAARRSHHAATDLEPGHVLRESDTKLVRPASGAPASMDLSGRRLLRSVRAGEPVEVGFLSPATDADSHGVGPASVVRLR